MTKKELIEALEDFDDDQVVICKDEDGMWVNIKEVERDGFIRTFGSESPFSN
jgi:hypothetical protein